jgi:hypothetical protein
MRIESRGLLCYNVMYRSSGGKWKIDPTYLSLTLAQGLTSRMTSKYRFDILRKPKRPSIRDRRDEETTLPCMRDGQD